MGTRNLTIVRSNGKVKVAQYGQWDGYPTGQGQTIADFLSKADIKKFKSKVDKLKIYTNEDIQQAYKDAGHDGGEWITMEVSNRKNKAHPALDRDHGAGILELIYNGTVDKVKLDEGFKNDGLFCEYCYEIDLDKGTVVVNGRKVRSFEEWCKHGLMKRLK